MKTELLSPAGDIESAYAAFHYGADAVYLGLGQFSARAEAVNFTPEQLQVLTGYAHSLGKKVLVAVNTVVFEEELSGLIDTLTVIADAKADGVIVQDLGVARLVRKYFPSLRLHASTQIAVHNRAGVETMKSLGFKRVVLARELTLGEIKDIRRSVKDIELEVFIHGALCYCYSGLCQFSSVYTGRSANRGKCVYPCREEFFIDGVKKHPFSMKDLSQEENALSLAESGVAALKIEGRKKSPLYVAAVTDYYRSLLDGEKDKIVLSEKLNNIRCIFSRPTTSLYLKDRTNRTVVDPDVVGHRGLALGSIERIIISGKDRFIRFRTAYPVSRYDGIQIDLPGTERPFGFSAEKLRLKNKDVFRAESGETVDIALPEKAPYLPEKAAVYLSSASAVKSAYPFNAPKESLYRPAEKIHVFVHIGEQEITASYDLITVQKKGNFSQARSPETALKSIQDAFAKTGDSGLALEHIEIHNPDNFFVPASLLNELRRELYEQAASLIQNKKTIRTAALKQKILETEKPEPVTRINEISYLIKTDSLETLSRFTAQDWAILTEAVIEISSGTTDISRLPLADKNKIRWALPTITRGWELPEIEKEIQKLIQNGWTKFEIGNVWGLQVLKDKKLDISFDWPMYVANTSAAKASLEMGASSFVVSPETPDPELLFKTFPGQATALIYQDIPLFVSETCPRAAAAGKCIHCGGTYRSKTSSRYGKFELVARSCRHWLLNEKPHVRKKEAAEARAARMRLDFMFREPDSAQSVQIFRCLTNPDQKG